MRTHGLYQPQFGRKVDLSDDFQTLPTLRTTRNKPEIDTNSIFNDFFVVNKKVSGFCALNLLVWSNCKEQTLETSHSTMSENRPMGQLCARIAADRDHVCPN